jgi:hypothetical protein
MGRKEQNAGRPLLFSLPYRVDEMVRVFIDLAGTRN